MWKKVEYLTGAWKGFPVTQQERRKLFRKEFLEKGPAKRFPERVPEKGLPERASFNNNNNINN